MSYRGKHRKMSAATKNIARIAIAGIAVGTPLAIAATPAQAAGSVDWDAVAKCESGNKWNTNTGNGYQGGLQFSASTWKAYGGQGSAANASREEQIAVAERVLQGQGIGAWPVCGKKGGSGTTAKSSAKAPAKKTTTAAPKKAAAPQAPAAPAAATVAQSNPLGDYTVVAGDTLSKLATQFKIEGGYKKLQELNAQYIPNADFIVVGQKIATK